MSFKALHLCLLSILVYTSFGLIPKCLPNQIHLSFGDDYYLSSKLDGLWLPQEVFNSNQAYLVWESRSNCNFTVQINNVTDKTVISNKTVDFSQNITYNFTQYHDLENNGTYTSVAYTSLISGLLYDTSYQYTISYQNGTSAAGPYSFSLANPNVTASPKKIILFGNIDNQAQGNMTLSSLTDLVTNEPSQYAGLIQLGGAPDLEAQNGTAGDIFFNSLSQFATNFSIIMNPGGQNSSIDQTLFNLRVKNPNVNMTQNNYFSFNLQGVHFISINFDFYDASLEQAQKSMISWVTEDLTKADDAEHRNLWPWVVVLLNKPIYCIQNGGNVSEQDTCYNYYAQRKDWDTLFYNYNVDLVIQGHVNDYERLAPIYTNKSFPYTAGNDTNHDIVKAGYPVYIVEGFGGVNQTTLGSYEASGYGKFVSTQPGYGVLYTQQQNNSDQIVLVYEHYQSDTDTKIDYLNLYKTQPGAGTDTDGDDDTMPHSFWPKFLILFGMIAAVILIWVAWTKRKRSPDNVRLNPSSDFRPGKFYGGKRPESNISMVDLIL